MTFDSETEALIARYQEQPETLMRSLLTIQQARGNAMDKSLIIEISKRTGIPAAKLYGFTEFYAMFSRNDRGQHVIRVCDSPSCHDNGAQVVMKAILSRLHLQEPGDETPDGLFTVETCQCIGMCDRAPVAWAQDKVYSHLDRDNAIEDMIRELEKADPKASLRSSVKAYEEVK